MPTARVSSLYTVLVLVNVAAVVAWIIALGKRRYLCERPTDGRRRHRLRDELSGYARHRLATAQITALFKLRADPADESIPGTLNAGKLFLPFFSAMLFFGVPSLSSPCSLACMVISSASVPGSAQASKQAVCRGAASNCSWGGTADRRGFLCDDRRSARPSVLGNGDEPVRLALRRRGARQLRVRCTDVHRHRQLRPQHGAARTARHASDRRLPDHDGKRRRADPGRDAWVSSVRAVLSNGCALGLALGGLGRCTLCTFPLVNKYRRATSTLMRWFVIVVIIYAAVSMLRSARASTVEARRTRDPVASQSQCLGNST